jgi:hypothetical protein
MSRFRSTEGEIENEDRKARLEPKTGNARREQRWALVSELALG